jgi:hypothetical protein
MYGVLNRGVKIMREMLFRGRRKDNPELMGGDII